jgi:hypothetical protein
MLRKHSGRSLAAALGMVVLAACVTTTPSPTWTGDGIHVVDGYWVLAEHPCDMASADACVEEVRAAEAALGVVPAVVVRRATADLPALRSVRSDGQVSIKVRNTTGLEAFAILDLADGSRKVVGIGCLGVPGPQGRDCRATPFDEYRVGAAPTF